MARPDVTISAPDPLFVGRDLAIEVNVTAIKQTKVDFIEARLDGEQGWSVGSGKSRISSRVVYPKLAQTLIGPGVLPAASTTRFVARFQLPHGTPPTHEVRPAYSRMRFRIHISIPWALDGRHHYDFAVRIPPPPISRAPMMVRSTAVPDKPRIELGLASTHLIAGEELVGTCAVFHLDDSDPRDVSLALVPELTLFGRGRSRERRGAAIAGTVTLPAGSAGTSVPFRIEIPATLTPTFEAANHALQWCLVARTGSFFGSKVDAAVPLQMFDRSAASTTPRLAAAPRIGDELGLSVAPASPLRHIFFKDVEVDIAAWDRAHHVQARYPDQAIPFLREVVPALMASGRLGTMVQWEDSELVFERKVVDVTDEDLDIISAQLDVLALTIAAALSKITAPPGLTADLPAWHALSRTLGGKLALGDLAIHGTLDGAPVDLGLAWVEGRPAIVHVAVGSPDLGSELLRTIVIWLPRPASDVLAANAAERLVELITRWPEDVAELRVENGVASAAYLLPSGEPPVADAERVRTLVEGLRAVLGVLDPGAGPYR